MFARLKKWLFSIAIFLPAIAGATATSYIPTSVTDGLTQAAVDMGLIGAAVMAVFLAIFAFKWLRKAL